MEHIKKLLTQLLSEPDKKEDFVDLIVHMLEMVKHVDERMYNCLVLKLHTEMYGHHFSEHMAKHAVKEMKNADGTTGEHWSLEQTTNLMKQMGLNCNVYDWYYALNMLHSDASPIFKNDTSLYAKYAVAVYFKDIDGDDTKLFNQYVSSHYKLF